MLSWIWFCNHVSVMQMRSIFLRVIDSRSSSILGARDMTLDSIIEGTNKIGAPAKILGIKRKVVLKLALSPLKTFSGHFAMIVK